MVKNTNYLIIRNKSPKMRELVSKALKGRVFSPKTIAKMRLSHKGQIAWNKGKKMEYKPRKSKFGIRPSPKEYLQYIRNSVLEALGGKCIKCGFIDKRALQIDHINGGGSKERKTREYKGSFHSNVLRSFLNKENKYQLLCANCNWIKRSENKEATGKPKNI